MVYLTTPWWVIIRETLVTVAFLDWFGIAVATLLTSWIVRIRMQRRVQIDLGKTADDKDLMSIQTWMNVDEVEQNKNPGREWAPETSVIDCQSSKSRPSVLSVLKILASGRLRNKAQHRGRGEKPNIEKN